MQNDADPQTLPSKLFAGSSTIEYPATNNDRRNSLRFREDISKPNERSEPLYDASYPHNTSLDTGRNSSDIYMNYRSMEFVDSSVRNLSKPEKEKVDEGLSVLHKVLPSKIPGEDNSLGRKDLLETPEDLGDPPNVQPIISESDCFQVSSLRASVVFLDDIFCDSQSEYYENNIKPRLSNSVSESTVHYLRLKHAFDAPNVSYRLLMVEAFIEKTSSLLPVIDQDMLDQELKSPLLALVVCLAGARVQTKGSYYLERYPPQTLYERAKALIDADYERSPLILLTSLCLIQWSSNSAPGQIDKDSAWCWLAVAIRVAMQMGIHIEDHTYKMGTNLRKRCRRIFWTLFYHDRLTSVMYGRPSMIRLEDCKIEWPSLSDFPEPTINANIFVHYVSLVHILGKISLSTNFGQGFKSKEEEEIVKCRKQYFCELAEWVDQLPPSLHLCQVHGQTDDGRNSNGLMNYGIAQLYTLYFATICVLYRNPIDTGKAHIMAILASSCLSRLVENVMIRDRARMAGSANAWMLLVSSLPQIASLGDIELFAISKHEIEVMLTVMQEVKRNWLSAEMYESMLRSIYNTALFAAESKFYGPAQSTNNDNNNNNNSNSSSSSSSSSNGSIAVNSSDMGTGKHHVVKSVFTNDEVLDTDIQSLFPGFTVLECPKIDVMSKKLARTRKNPEAYNIKLDKELQNGNLGWTKGV